MELVGYRHSGVGGIVVEGVKCIRNSPGDIASQECQA